MAGNLLFVCNEGFDTPGPSNHLIATLVEDLLEYGFHVTLIQSRRERVDDEIPDNLKDQANLEVFSIDRKIVSKSAFLRRYIEEMTYHFKARKVWKKRKDFDAVFVQSCPTVVFSIILLKLFARKPILYSVQDIWPGSAVSTGVMRSRPLAAFFRAIQKFAYRRSDAITVISEDMKSRVIEQGVPEDKIFPIVNWFDDRSVREVAWDDNRFVRKYNLRRDRFYVQYAGTMGFVFDYRMVLHVAERLQRNTDIVFQMIGRGSQKEAFVAEADKRGLTNIVFYPLEPQDMVSDVYSACSISLIPLKRGVIGNSVPSKAGLLMACKRAIVNSVDEDSDYYRIFDENDIGLSVSNRDPEAVAEAIFALYKDPEKRARMAGNGYVFGQKYYSRSENTAKFIRVFERLIGGTGAEGEED